MRAEEGVVTDISVIYLKYGNTSIIIKYIQSKRKKTKFLLNI
jgi:hypothetical protein